MLIILISPIPIVCIWAWLSYSQRGRAIRAVAQNQDSAQLLGMNVSTVAASTAESAKAVM